MTADGRGAQLKAVLRVGIAICLMLTSSCASHRIWSAEAADVGLAGQPFKHQSLSIGGQKGFTSEGTGYVTRDTCRSGALSAVDVRKNVGQTIVTLLTLGIVSPATIEYFCEKPKPPPPCNCPQDNEL